jgi:asparagine synthase (glutamine-hydrolysing)
MCGIAGYVDFGAREAHASVLSQMADRLGRRGPDGRGVFVDRACGLAHTRLSIIDVAGSPQPMRVPDSLTSLVYNGELYNYVALREELQGRGCRFATRGDTEVILRWVDQGWETALPRFDGMFAFGAWHSRRNALLLARDPLGVKPLFYARPEPHTLVFGSEIKALLAHPAVRAQLDEDGLRQALRFRAVYGARSLYRGILQVEPGSWIEFSQSGLRGGRFYDLVGRARECRDEAGQKNERELVTDGDRLFVAAVRKRLVADVPVGAFLSGGLDSSLVAAVMSECRGPGEKVCTFSVGFAGDTFTELPFARDVARHLGTAHTEVVVTGSDYARRLKDLTSCRDAPVSEPADVAIARMSEVAAETVKVVLSGEGADEVFGGYPKYAFADAHPALRWALRAFGAGRAARVASLLGAEHRRALVAARSLAHAGELDRLTQWFSYLDAPLLRELLPGLGWTGGQWGDTVRAQSDALARSSSFGPAARMQIVDCLTWLPGNLLERGDRMTMQAGLEARVPFLDKALAPWGIGLPSRLKVRGRAGKWVVRQWANRRLPPAVTRRRKWGFRVPLAAWLRGHLRPMLFDYLTSKTGLCGTYGDARAVNGLLEDHDQGRADLNLTLWTLLTSEVWYQDVFAVRDGGRRALATSAGAGGGISRESMSIPA